MAKKKSYELKEFVDAESSILSNSILDNYLSISRAMNLVGGRSAIDSVLESFDSHQRAIDSAMAALVQPTALEMAMESFNSHQRAIDSAMAAVVQPTALEMAMESFNSHQRAIDSAMAAIVQPNALEIAMESFNSHHRIIDSALASITNFSSMENTLVSFAEASSMMLRDSSSLSTIFASMERAEISAYELDNLEFALTSAADEFNNANSQATLASIFLNLPPLLQAIFFYILMHIFLPQVNSISANLLTPVVGSFLEGNDSTDREKVKEIKKIPTYLNGVTTEGLRFITGNNVRLRSRPSTKSEILDELRLGQVVSVSAKNRNWIEVAYTYEDGESMSGWVFTRYTAKFVR